MALSSILELIDRSIYEAIHRVAVANGFAVDLSVAGIAEDEVAYKAAEQTIKNDKGFVVDIFGHSSSKGKGERKEPRITYIPERLIPGDIGNTLTTQYVRNGDTYQSLIEPGQTSEYLFQIRINALNAHQFRTLHSIVSLAVPNRSYVRFYDPTIEVLPSGMNSFLVTQYGYNDAPDNVKSVLSGSYMFMAVDLFEYNAIDLQTNIHPIESIRVHTLDDVIQVNIHDLSEAVWDDNLFWNDDSIWVDTILWDDTNQWDDTEIFKG